jgi:hypothetical protein
MSVKFKINHVAVLVSGAALFLGAPAQSLRAQCVDYSNDPAGCQPSTFKTPTGQMPSVRVGRDGQLDPKSSEADARAGAAKLEKELHLYRNFVPLHWVMTVPSEPDPANGGWKSGDLDASGDGRGLGIAGNCIFTGHGNGAGKRHAVNIFKIQTNPEKEAPIQVGEIPAWVEGNQGFDDRELRSLVYKTSKGEDRYIMIRNGGTATAGWMQTYGINMNTCLPTSQSDVTDFHSQSHEFFMWHDPANTNRVLIYMAIWTAGLPDPDHAGLYIPDMYVMAITDEKTGEILQKPLTLATFSLHEVGGPPINEKPDATGLFSDGRFLDFSNQKNRAGRGGNTQRVEQNKLHSMSVTDDGERVYVAGTTAGMYVIDSEAIAHHTDSDLAAGRAGCNLHATIASVSEVIDASKLPAIANDCVHMVVNNDPGLKAFLASNAAPQSKVERYLVMLTRSRFDVYPPIDATPTGTHSAVFVPNRPSQSAGNTKNRPAYVWVTDENGGCPLNYARMISVESEINPIMVGAFSIPDNQLDQCLDQAITEPNGARRRQVAQQNHNPTVFKNLVFNTWYGHGLRAIDISIPQTPREVGYIMNVPQGIVRTYPVFKDGLIYWVDNRTGLHVAKYTGPRANELPGPGSGVYEGNATSPHR